MDRGGAGGAWVVSLLVRVETTEARRQGLERHVCEVAAVLLPRACSRDGGLVHVGAFACAGAEWDRDRWAQCCDEDGGCRSADT